MNFNTLTKTIKNKIESINKADQQKTLKINAIELIPEFEKMLAMDESVVKAITDSMKTEGFKAGHELHVWNNNGRLILIDGHTRRLGKQLGVSSKTVEKARVVLKEATKEQKEAIRKDELSVKQVYNQLRKKEETEKSGKLSSKEKSFIAGIHYAIIRINEKKNLKDLYLETSSENFDFVKMTFDPELSKLNETFKLSSSKETIKAYKERIKSITTDKYKPPKNAVGIYECIFTSTA